MNRSVKTIGLWVLLIALFVAFYQLFGKDPSHVGASSFRVSPWWGLFVVVVIGFVAFGRFQATRPWRKQYDAAMQAFARGRFAEALDLWSQCYEKTPWKPVVRFNIASARINLWQLKRAREDLLESLTLGAKVKHPTLPTLAHAQLAFLEALEGNVSDSRASTAKVGAPSKEFALNILPLTEALLDLREGRLEQAQRALRSSEMRQISGTLGELVRVLDAYCVFLGSGEVRHVDKVALFQEATPEELLHAWPDLAAFLARAPQS